MNKTQTVITKSSEETKKFGEEFAKKLHLGSIVCLYGNLGAGKTTFVQGMAEGLGIKSRIISPTFTIIRQYQISNIKYPISNFYHVDLYRVRNEKEIKELGLKELFNNPENIIVIEWAKKMKKLLPKKRIDIYFVQKGENKREILIEKHE